MNVVNKAKNLFQISKGKTKEVTGRLRETGTLNPPARTINTRAPQAGWRKGEGCYRRTLNRPQTKRVRLTRRVGASTYGGGRKSAR